MEKNNRHFFTSTIKEMKSRAKSVIADASKLEHDEPKGFIQETLYEVIETLTFLNKVIKKYAYKTDEVGPPLHKCLQSYEQIIDSMANLISVSNTVNITADALALAYKSVGVNLEEEFTGE